ncbi:DUF5050 domain-containing protein [Shewanella maritima]|uniref:DUF5050 domain-containing protein n=1 Tax=Shewanella maritima TaxID=2520507 RepID=A0A411PJR6_9GAMM|nr:DUF5050 domain-containing protein [Shewanella maritima]QBF83851.1 DUF5050 domain-containing protein [Shewanella maritima]
MTLAQYQIGPCTLDTNLLLLSCNELQQKLPAKVCELLQLFLTSEENIVSRADAIEQIWAGNQGVGEKGFTNSVWVIRKAFKDLGVEDEVFLTLPKVGYQLLLSNQALNSVATINTETKPQAGRQAKPWLWPGVVVLLIMVIVAQAFWPKDPQAPVKVQTNTVKQSKVTNYEGVEEHIAVSHSGQYLAMQWRAGEQLGKIYIQDLTQQQAPLNQITLGEHEEASPAWSLSDSKLAYVRIDDAGSCEVRVRHLQNNTDTLVASDCFYLPFKRVLTWSSHDDDTLIYAKQLADRVALFAYSELTGQSQQVSFPAENEVDFAPHELASQNRFAFIREKSASMQMSLLVQNGAKVKTPITDDEKQQSLTPLIQNRVTIVDFDYDVSEQVFYVNYLDGGELLLSKIGLDGELLQSIPHSGMPSNLSFDQAKQTLFSSQHISKEYIAQVKLADKQTINTISSSSRDMYARFSKQTQDVLFLSNRAQLWAVWKNNGASSINLTKDMGNAGVPSVSPTSSQFAVSINKDNDQTLYLGDINSAIFTPVDTQGVTAENLSWSSDGNTLYFKGTKAGENAIYAYNIATKQQTVVLEGEGNYALEGEAPHILYLSKFNQNGIWRFDRNTSQLTRITDALTKYDFGSFFYQDGYVYFVMRTNEHDKIERISLSGEQQTVLSFSANTIRKFYGLSPADGGSILLTLKVANEADVMKYPLAND